MSTRAPGAEAFGVCAVPAGQWRAVWWRSASACARVRRCAGTRRSGRAVVEQVEVCPSGAVQALQAWGTALPGGRARDNLVPKGVPTGRRTRYTCVQGAQSCVRWPIRGVRLLASRQAHDCRDAAQGLGLRRQADRAGTFEIFKDNKGEYRFRLKGRNGEISRLASRPRRRLHVKRRHRGREAERPARHSVPSMTGIAQPMCVVRVGSEIAPRPARPR
jgi:hypothetical protein